MESLHIVWQYMPRIITGMILTLEIAVMSVIVSMLIGFMGATMRLSRSPILSFMAGFYSSVARGIPDIVWMLMIYYSVQIGLNNLTDALGLNSFEISPFAAGVFTLSFIFGAYFTETYRGAILAIPHGQIEAGYAYGMRPLKVMRRITFPLMMRYALPGMRNNWLVLTKSTALVSIIGLDDMTRIAQQAGSSTHMGFIFNVTSAVLFLVLTSLSLLIFDHLDKVYQQGVTIEEDQ